jgi:hypothetical protein
VVDVERAARQLFVVALGLGAAALALLTLQGLLMTSLFEDGIEFDGPYLTALAYTAVMGTLCLVDVTALVLTLRGGRLVAHYREERAAWREAREAQGSLLRPR